MIGLAGCSSTATSTNAGAPRPADPSEPRPQVERLIDRQAAARAPRTGEVYLMRGLMDVFSRGIDEMAAKINRAGVYALNTSYTNWQPLADEIIAREKRGEVSHPVIIVGHSLGANDASKMATYLGARGVKVAYVVGFDPTEPGYLGKNVDKVVNYYLPNGDNRMYKTSGFKGTLQNVSVTDIDGISHTTIEKNPTLQNRVIGRIVGMTRKKK
ncbi:MAG: hypothetical protein BroJett030_25340 [Alphaproteobacteria bacterium]|nr:MAG: hypothetical protein BroJett030_25340 [Alphaproteobacteria bacterium]